LVGNLAQVFAIRQAAVAAQARPLRGRDRRQIQVAHGLPVIAAARQSLGTLQRLRRRQLLVEQVLGLRGAGYQRALRAAHDVHRQGDQQQRHDQQRRHGIRDDQLNHPEQRAEQAEPQIQQQAFQRQLQRRRRRVLELGLRHDGGQLARRIRVGRRVEFDGSRGGRPSSDSRVVRIRVGVAQRRDQRAIVRLAVRQAATLKPRFRA
jgi:hypothetical protein